MKKLLSTFLASLLSGLLFVGGALIAIEIHDNVSSSSNKSTRSDLYYVRPPENIEILEQKIVPNSPYLTIEGRVQNNSKLDYYYLNIEISVFAGKALMNRCDFKVYKVNSGESRKLKKECSGVGGSNLPDNVFVKLSVNVGALIKEPISLN